MKKKLHDFYKYSYWREWLIAVALIVALWFGALQGYNFALRQGKKACNNYALQTQRETKYVNMAWGDWSCMVSVNGNWIDRENVREFGEQP